MKVWPDGMPETFRGDQFRCRLMAASGGAAKQSDVVALLGRLDRRGHCRSPRPSASTTSTASAGYTLGQGE